MDKALELRVSADNGVATSKTAALQMLNQSALVAKLTSESCI